jgi:hypothetical protein
MVTKPKRTRLKGPLRVNFKQTGAYLIIILQGKHRSIILSKIKFICILFKTIPVSQSKKPHTLSTSITYCSLAYITSFVYKANNYFQLLLLQTDTA